MPDSTTTVSALYDWPLVPWCYRHLTTAWTRWTIPEFLEKLVGQRRTDSDVDVVPMIRYRVRANLRLIFDVAPTTAVGVN